MKRAIPITTLFLDIGGVLITDGWDHHARKRSGLTLRQIGETLGGLEYKTVGKAVQRFEASLKKSPAWWWCWSLKSPPT
jgi:hypothetical protein